MNKCSRNGCLNEAKFLVRWRNPKLHKPDQIKTWGACQEHYDYLVSFLTIRGFFLVAEPANA